MRNFFPGLRISLRNAGRSSRKLLINISTSILSQIAEFVQVHPIYRLPLSGEMQAYCDIEDDMVKGMFGTIVQGYLKKGYNRDTAEMMAREFFRYES